MRNGNEEAYRLKTGLAEMLKGGVILDVTCAEQARIAEDAGAAAVMALERVPADIRREGGVARMAAIDRIAEVRAAVSIPVMAKCRIGHFVEARVLEALGVDFVDESEVLTPADEEHHVDKHAFRVPFVCGARDLGEALRRIGEGAALIRTKGEAGSGDIVEAVRHLRRIAREVRELAAAPREEWMARAKALGAPYELVARVATDGRLPVANFAAGGIATPADAALCMALGAEAVFVGSGIFKSSDPEARARAIVRATTHWQDAGEVLEASRRLGDAMPGTAARTLADGERLAERGW
ncbi:MAG: pyridoxal 5'-phosphate synthase lyase subunit PdxS [Thermodesulfobacteriota bacterium]